MENDKYRSLPPEEEMRTFLKIGRRLHILDYSYWEQFSGSKSEYGYKNINAVITLAFFIEWLYLQKNVHAMNGFIAEMNAMSDDSLREHVVDKALDYYKECAENANNNFARAMVISNWEHVLKERNGNKRCVRNQYWPVMGNYLKSWWENNLDYNNIIHIQFDEVLGTRKIVYFHGFGSSCFGSTVKTLQELLPDFTIIAEDIDVDPMMALPVLKAKCALEQPELVVGTSMGGLYAQQMRGFKRICINPAFDLSQHKDILHEGTFEFLNPRRNGDTTFTITPEIISHFKEMEAQQFDSITDDDKENVYGLFADNDTTVNCEDIFRQHYKNVIHFHGEHRLNREAIEDVLVPLIKEITNK